MPKLTSTVSITQLKARSKTLQRQLNNKSMLFLQTCRKCFQCQDGYKGKSLYELRNIISRAQSDQELYNIFYNTIIKLVPNLGDLIEKTVQCQIEFLKLETCILKTEDQTYVLEPIFELWKFLLKTIFEKPILLLEKEDSKDGNLVLIVRESLPSFVAECIPISSTCRLTDDILVET